MVQPITPTRETLTGRVRGRRQLLTGKVVMQVEVLVEKKRSIYPLMPPPVSDQQWFKEWRERAEAFDIVETYWRDARPLDVMTQEVYRA